MKSTIKRIVFAVSVGLLLYGLYYGLSPLWRGSTINEPAPAAETIGETNNPSTDSATNVIARAEIEDTTIHPASGSVVLIQTDNHYVIRYENFKTLNGPDLFVYLSNDTAATDIINLGPLKATEGNFNYAVPDEVDFSRYPYVLVWCKEFGVLFNSAHIGRQQNGV